MQPEPLAEAAVSARVPKTPFGFIWFLIKSHFAMRVSLLVCISLFAAAVDAFAPLGFSHLVNGVLTARSLHLAFATVLPWVGLIAGLWLGAGIAYRGYEAVDIGTSPRMRALAQKYLFSYMLGHSPRYFQDNFAGKLGQKIKQAGQATVTILQIICFEMVRVTGSVLLGAVLMGMFWKRATKAGGFWGLLIGTLTSIALWAWVKLDPSALRYVALSPDAKDMAENMYRALWSVSTCMIVVFVVSLFGKARPVEELNGLVYGATKLPVEEPVPFYKNEWFWTGTAIVGFLALNIYFW